MTLVAGVRLGPYQITRPIGAGGMGEVYCARDTRLQRDVAIKVLSAAVEQDPDRRARFEREARAVAALTHPNIVAIHDVGTHEGTAYLVTELLEGETLRQRLGEGALAPRKAADVAIQIATGLAAAHEKGIVHRDLKPENVFVTREGRVKILDFGLAAPSVAIADVDSATIAVTEPGVILGTVGYMSPEQVRGAKVDQRTDIFALGAVLFEMLTGRRAFSRETPAETMTAILREDVPELSSSGRQIPPLDRIVRRCLEKNPTERMQAARDVAIALEAVSGSDSAGVLSPLELPARRRRPWRALALSVALLLVGLAVGFFAAMRAPGAVPAELPRFTRLTFRRGEIRAARFAPDGQSIFYSAVWDSQPLRVYPVRLEHPRAEAAPIADADLLAVSRTGDVAIATHPRRESLFIERGTLARISSSGGAPRELLEDVVAADIAADGRIAVVRSERGRTRLEFPIGTTLYETSGWLSSPRISRNGTRVAFHDHPLHDDDRGWPAIVEVATRVKRNLTSQQQDSLLGLAWAQNGQEICFGSVDNTIQCAGVEKPVVRVVTRGTRPFMLFDIADDGRMLAATFDATGAQVAGEFGGREVDASWQDAAFPIDFSADGTQLLFESLDYGVHLLPLDGGPPVRLAEGIPAGISPDGRSVLALAPGVPTTIAIVPTGPGATRTLPRGPVDAHTSAAWMPDGRRVVIAASERGHGSRLYLQDIPGGEPHPFSGEGVRLMTFTPRVVSPDGGVVIALGPDQQPALYPVDGSQPRPIAGLGNDLVPIGWGESSDVIYARHRTLGRLVPLFKVDLTSGRRQPVGQLGLADPKGAPLVLLTQVSRDGRHYAYYSSQALWTLFLVEDAKP